MGLSILFLIVYMILYPSTQASQEQGIYNKSNNFHFSILYEISVLI